ncbi:MAG: trypsin-like peptidase domain-containing protein [Desulfobacterales bacterium]|nr:trypsin-like peptidase domain-containing protein [Desulfobacterales bacterium]
MKKNKNFKINNLLWPAAALLVLVIGAIWTNAGVVEHAPTQIRPQGYLPAPTNSRLPSGQQGDTASPRTALMMQEGISKVVSIVRPAVVGVSKAPAGQIPAGTGLTYLQPYSGSKGVVGSGVIIDRRGYILTTFQTVGTANVVQVTLFSGGRRQYQADVIGVDPNTDLVLLKIRAQEIFPAIILGNSDLIEVGDLVLSIGSPFGFSRTVTMGIVSSNRRRLNIDGARYPDMIQTDAAINEGNDGGPLVNIKGDVIGINMACYMPDNHYSGIGFAVPINDALEFINARLGA